MKDRDCRHIVLTLRHRQVPLNDQISRIYQCFSNLRKHNSWKRHVRGGAAFLELKVGKDKAWHVHLHIVAEGDYFPHHVLSAAWLVATGDSDVVGVFSIPDRGRVASYVAKYATKALDSHVVFETAFLEEAVLALRGRRGCFTFGNWRGMPLKPKSAPTEGWKLIGRLEHVMIQADRGEPWAVAIMTNLKWKEKRDERSTTPDSS